MICIDCNQEKPQAYNNAGKTFRRCRECLSIRAREQRHEREAKNPKLKEARLSSNKKGELKRRYGITEHEFNSKLVNQLFGCAICKQSRQYTDKQLSVDHNHNTGQVRDLLCNRCNNLLSYVENNEDLII